MDCCPRCGYPANECHCGFCKNHAGQQLDLSELFAAANLSDNPNGSSELTIEERLAKIEKKLDELLDLCKFK